MPIHPTAIVDPGAQIAESADIGPFCVISADVQIGAGTHLMANVYVEGITSIGSDNVFFPYSPLALRRRI